MIREHWSTEARLGFLDFGDFKENDDVNHGNLITGKKFILPELLVHFFQDFQFKILLVVHRPDIDVLLHVLARGENGLRVRSEVILIDLDFVCAVDLHNFSLCYLAAHLNFTLV